MMNEEELRSAPANALDFQNQIVNPEWGRAGAIPSRLKKRLEVHRRSREAGGEDEAISTWDYYGTFTRDLRLGYLSPDEAKIAAHLKENEVLFNAEEWMGAGLILGARVASMVEISQSKNGNLRRQIKTTTQEQRVSYSEPAKRWGKAPE